VAFPEEMELIEFRMSVINSEKIHFAFSGLANGVKDWTTHIWPAVRSRAIRPWLTSQFEAEGRGEHGKWAQLSPAYAAWKEKKYPGKKLLERTGKMKDDLLNEDNKGIVTPRTLEYGTGAFYAIFHQTGTKRMPARRIFDPERDDERGSLKQLIRSAVAFGVSNHARALGFYVTGGDASPSEATAIGKDILSAGGLRAYVGGSVAVSEGI
jgi:phage gpG-like protein